MSEEHRNFLSQRKELSKQVSEAGAREREAFLAEIERLKDKKFSDLTVIEKEFVEANRPYFDGRAEGYTNVQY